MDGDEAFHKRSQPFRIKQRPWRGTELRCPRLAKPVLTELRSNALGQPLI
jgi:hypothetical protein